MQSRNKDPFLFNCYDQKRAVTVDICTFVGTWHICHKEGNGAKEQEIRRTVRSNRGTILGRHPGTVSWYNLCYNVTSSFVAQATI